MPIASAIPAPTADQVDVVRSRLANAGVTTVIGSCVNSAGLQLAKSIPLDRLGSFATTGLGVSPVWNVFAIDGVIAFTEAMNVIGDMRMRLDLARLRSIGGGVAWAPTEFFDQSGVPLPVSPRVALRRVQAELEADGLEARMGHELEFVLTGADGEPYPRHGWVPYGLGPLLDQEVFASDLIAAAKAAGIPLEQFHAEYAPGQFELSLPPANPVQAADDAVLARLLVCRVARRHGLLASFSPFPFADGGGNGAHQHLSLTRRGAVGAFGDAGAAGRADAGDAGAAGDAVTAASVESTPADVAPLFSGADGLYGITSEGGSAIAGILRALPGMQGILAGSVLSPARLQPGYWSGAFACWGRENREAAVRFLEATPGNPHGANVEVKIADSSANPYLAAAAILGSAHAGIRDSLELPAEVTVDPATLSAAERERTGTVALATTLSDTVEALAASAPLRDLIGDDLIDSLLAVRRHELTAHGAASLEDTAAAFRFAWSS